MDAILLPGDLVNTLSIAYLRSSQMSSVREFLQDLTTECSHVAVCSGNHDIWLGEPKTWLEELKIPHLHNQLSQRFEIKGTSLLVNCLPWIKGQTPDRSSEVELILKESSIRKAEVNHWIWLQHEPPFQTQISRTGKSSWGGNPQVNKWVQDYQPDFVFCGHIHEAPFGRGSWNETIGKTRLFNGGRAPRFQRKAEPPHLILNLDRHQVIWNWGDQQEVLDLRASLPPVDQPQPQA